MSKCVRQSITVSPVTRFLPDVTTRDSSRLDHLGYRLASLAALPASCNLSRVRLAEAGFHYDPRANRSAVVCHRCGAAFSLQQSPSCGEEPSFLSVSSPLAFHRSFSPQCPFLTSLLEGFAEPPPSPSPSPSQPPVLVSRVHQPVDGSSAAATVASSTVLSSAGAGLLQAAAGRVGDLSEDCDARLPSDALGSTLQPSVTSSLCQPASAVTDAQSSAEDRPPMSLGGAVYPQFSTAQSRLTTFSHWPLAAIFPPHTLVALGFYYAGYADCVRCFYCGVGLKSWDERDDVTTEHIRWRPQCGFLLATKGRQFIQSTLRGLGQEGRK